MPIRPYKKTRGRHRRFAGEIAKRHRLAELLRRIRLGGMRRFSKSGGRTTGVPVVAGEASLAAFEELGEQDRKQPGAAIVG